MSRSLSEIQITMTALRAILQRHTDLRGIVHRPYGLDWIEFERHMYRLLLLNGFIRPGDRLPTDPWELFLAEYAPYGVRRASSEETHAAAAATAAGATGYFPTSILVAHTPSASPPARGMENGGQINAAEQVPGPRRNHRVRFDDDVVERNGSTARRVPGGIPRYFS
ncbi:hypothetical protein BO71DRAFT_327184 [Aspergillus ellipticus CBS 707.79]|uniref:Uncharacterized protein n=1 Tax=Aspergillus ellipticus CBS 707.79 TaxID=1448320 RepID=A0A319D8Q3_9EURO|nr:hypothetical protein BO71DRAFT_327184 [Aspergillus ellipticus CBS 707.79]